MDEGEVSEGKEYLGCSSFSKIQDPGRSSFQAEA